MTDQFFERPILNSLYEGPRRHWELDKDGQPTQEGITKRRASELKGLPAFLSPSRADSASQVARPLHRTPRPRALELRLAAGHEPPSRGRR